MRAPWAFGLAILLAVLLLPGTIGLPSHPASSSGRPGPDPAAVPPVPAPPPAGGPRHLSTQMLPARAGARPEYIGGSTAWLAYDPVDQSFWVAVEPGTVDVVPASNTYNVTASFATGSQPFGVAVDNGTGDVYVSNTGSDNISIYSGAGFLGSVAVGHDPLGIAFDPRDREMFVANSGSDNVSVISTVSRSVVATISVGHAPVGVVYDPASHEVFVADSGSYQVSVLSAASNSVVATVPAGIDPYGVALDNLTDTIYVTNQGSSNISVLAASTNTIVGTIPVYNAGGVSLQGLVFDAATGQLWVGGGYAVLVIVDTTLGRVGRVQDVLPTDPSGAAYDPTSNTVCTTATGNSTFECWTNATAGTAETTVTVSETGIPSGVGWNLTAPGVTLRLDSTTVTFGACLTYDACVAPTLAAFSFGAPPADGQVAGNSGVVQLTGTAQSASGNVTFSRGPTLYPVSVSETGLAADTGWYATFDNTTAQATVGSASSTALVFWAPNGTYSLTLGTVTGYSVSPSGETLTVHGAALAVTVAYTTVAYAFDVYETGLPAGTPWYVNFTSGPAGAALPQSGAISGASVGLELENGSYSYTIATANPTYTTSPDRSIVIEGAPQNVYLSFRPLDFSALFTETGLPAGTSWSIQINGSSLAAATPQLLASLPAGPYSFSVATVSQYAPTPSTGSVTVGPGLAPVVPIAFRSTESFPVTFHETGLPLATVWGIAIGSTVGTSLAPNITLGERNGTYGYVVFSVPGFAASPYGVVTVAGSAVTVLIVFASAVFPVILIESGLANGTGWAATVRGAAGFNATLASTTNAIVFFLPNGTYSLTVPAVAGHAPTLSSTSFTVHGSYGTGPSVEFTPGPVPGGPSSGGAPWLYVELLGAGLVVLAVALGIALVRRRRTGP